jgi:hypothetical protein
MRNSEELHTLIERYLNHELSGEELKNFELEMAADAELRKEVQYHKEIQDIVFDAGILDVKSRLHKIHQRETVKGKDSQTWYLVALLIGLIVVSSVCVYLFSNRENNKASQPDVPKITVDTILDTKDTNPGNHTGTNSTDVAVPPSKKQNATSLSPVITNDSKPDSPDSKTDVVKINSDTITKKDNTSLPAVTNNPVGVDCSRVTITGDVNTSETCRDESNGTIMISLNSIRGGTKPYKFSLDREDNFAKVSQFNSLAAGIYEVYIKDRDDCVFLFKKTEIKSKTCAKEYIFAPERGETWEVPLLAGKNGELKVFTRTGQVAYSIRFKSESGVTWNGTDNNGSDLPMGSYSFTIVYDGGEVEQGSVTVVR